MRSIAWMISLLSLFFGIVCVFGLNHGQFQDNYFAVPLTVSFIVLGLSLLIALLTGYRGGKCFYAALFLLCLSLLNFLTAYQLYRLENLTYLYASLLAGLLFLAPGVIFARLGHNRHIQDLALAQSAVQTYEPNSAAEPAHPGEIAGLHRPVQTWRAFILIFCSCGIYIIPLAYRMLKDLGLMRQSPLNVPSYLLGLFMPFLYCFVFYKIFKLVEELGRNAGLVFKFGPLQLTLLTLMLQLIFLIPKFLFPVAIAVSMIPYLLLNQQLNRLRLVYSHESPPMADRFSWRQLSLMSIGLPIMAFLIYANRLDYFHFMAPKLSKGQIIMGNTPTYQLQISDAYWRKLPANTLDKDTDLELIGSTLDQKVIVRVMPNQQHPLDFHVNNRRNIVLKNMKELQLSETRNLDSGADLTPISFATYSGREGALNIAKHLFVATIVTPQQAIEVIGQSPQGFEGGIPKLVNSLRLINSTGTP